MKNLNCNSALQKIKRQTIQTFNMRELQKALRELYISATGRKAELKKNCCP